MQMIDGALDDAAFRRLSGIDLNLLVVFAALLQHGSVTRSAQCLFVGQPAVSSSLKRLRALFGDPLFVKAGRGIVATDQARALAPAVGALLTRIDELTTIVPTFDPRAPMTLRIGLSDDNEIVFLPAIVQALAAQAPGVRLVTRPVSHTDICERLDAGDIDFGMSVFGELKAWHVSRTLYQQGYGCLFDPAAHGGRTALSLADYAKCPQVIVTFDGALGGKIDRVLQRKRLKREVHVGTTRFGSLPHLVQGTSRIASLPELIGRVLARSQRLAYCALPFDVPPGYPQLAWHLRHDRDPANLWLRELVIGCVDRVVGQTRTPSAEKRPAQAPRSARSRPRGSAVRGS